MMNASRPGATYSVHCPAIPVHALGRQAVHLRIMSGFVMNRPMIAVRDRRVPPLAVSRRSMIDRPVLGRAAAPSPGQSQRRYLYSGRSLIAVDEAVVAPRRWTVMAGRRARLVGGSQVSANLGRRASRSESGAAAVRSRFPAATSRDRHSRRDLRVGPVVPRSARSAADCGSQRHAVDRDEEIAGPYARIRGWGVRSHRFEPGIPPGTLDPQIGIAREDCPASLSEVPVIA